MTPLSAGGISEWRTAVKPLQGGRLGNGRLAALGVRSREPRKDPAKSVRLLTQLLLENTDQEAPIIRQAPLPRSLVNHRRGRGSGLNQVQALPVGVLSLTHHSRGEGPKRRSEFGRKDDVHLRDIGSEECVASAGDVHHDASELAVLIGGAKSVPTTTLDQAVTSIDVEALLAVPSLRSGGSRVSLRRGELNLVRQDVRPDADAMSFPIMPQWQPLTRKLSRRRLRSGKRIPGLQPLAIEGYRDPRPAPPQLAREKAVKHHRQVFAYLIDQPFEASHGHRPVGSRVVEHPIEALP